MGRWIAIVPARGGSKGIPGKNLAICGGKSLLQRTAEAARESGCFTRVVLSTDDPVIAEAGKRLGLDFLGFRPAEFAADESPMLPVIRDVVRRLEEKGEKIEGIVLLQPTSPLRNSSHIREALALMEKAEADTVVSVVEIPHSFTPTSALNMDAEGAVTPYLVVDSGPILRRQDKPKVFARNGPAILILRRAQIEKDSFYSGKTRGYPMSFRDSIDIDSPDDLKIAEALLASV